MVVKLGSTDVFSFEDFRSTGMLWAINRYIFHPRGYAMFMEMDDKGLVTGWGIYGDGSECWYFDQESDDEKFAAFTEFMEKITKRNAQPPEGDSA